MTNNLEKRNSVYTVIITDWLSDSIKIIIPDIKNTFRLKLIRQYLHRTTIKHIFKNNNNNNNMYQFVFKEKCKMWNTSVNTDMIIIISIHNEILLQS